MVGTIQSVVLNARLNHELAMNKKPFITIVTATMFACAVQQTCAEDFTTKDRKSLERMFTQALATNGTAYVALRSNIAAQGESVVVFLREKSTATNFHERVVANGMISWLNEPTKNQRRVELIRGDLAVATKMHPGMSRAIMIACGAVVKPKAHVDELNNGSSEAFLLEMALKQAWPLPDGNIKETGQTYAYWAQCYAAGILGICKGSDVFPVLQELSRSEQWELRAFSAGGLRFMKTYESAEVLFNMITDKEAEVRRVCRVGIMDLTDQDFGDAPQKYQAWWNENKTRWPFIDRRPGGKDFLLK